MVPFWQALATAAVREAMSNFEMLRAMWLLTVASLMNSARPISLLIAPKGTIVAMASHGASARTRPHDPEDTLIPLLTSAGIQNPAIRDALVGLLGKPVAECSALCIPTASYGYPMAGPAAAWRFVSGVASDPPMVGLGCQSLGVLELMALPSIEEDLWVPLVRETDALLVNGGDPLYLCHWMRQSGLADLLPSLPAVYVGLSAGSMVMTPSIGQDFVGWTPPSGGDETLGLVDFSIFPHLDHEMMPENTMADAERWAAGMPVPAYAIDDETAIMGDDHTVEVVSEGHWRYFARSGEA